MVVSPHRARVAFARSQVVVGKAYIENPGAHTQSNQTIICKLRNRKCFYARPHDSAHKKRHITQIGLKVVRRLRDHIVWGIVVLRGNLLCALVRRVDLWPRVYGWVDFMAIPKLNNASIMCNLNDVCV